MSKKREREKVRKEIRDSWTKTIVVAGTIEKNEDNR